MGQTGSDITQSGGGELRNQRQAEADAELTEREGRKGRIRKPELGFTGSEEEVASLEATEAPAKSLPFLFSP